MFILILLSHIQPEIAIHDLHYIMNPLLKYSYTDKGNPRNGHKRPCDFKGPYFLTHQEYFG